MTDIGVQGLHDLIKEQAAQIDAMKLTINNLSGIADDQSDEIIALQKVMKAALETLDGGFVVVTASRIHKDMRAAMSAKDNAEVSGLSTRPPGYRADFDGEKP